MKYSPADQETHFATRRIQVLMEGHPRNMTYWVVVRDPVQRPDVILAFFAFERWRRETRPVGWQWGEQKETWSLTRHEFVQLGNRATALETAKQEAVALSFPFDPSQDVLMWHDALHGPKQLCPACGEQGEVRGRLPVMCPECKRLLALGRATAADNDKQIYALAADDLVPYLGRFSHSERDKFSRQLADALARLAGSSVGERLRSDWHINNDSKIPYPDKRRFRDDDTRYAILLSAGQAEAFRAALAAFTDLFNRYYKEGDYNGQQWVTELANGKYRIDDLLDKQVKRI